MKKIILLIISLFLIGGCGATYQAEYARLMEEYKAGKVKITTDDFAKTTTYSMRENEVKTETQYASVKLLPILINKENKNYLYVNADTLSTVGWVFINNDDSLCFIADKDNFCLSSPGPYNTNLQRGYNGPAMYEFRIYPIAKDQFYKLGNSEKVRFKIYGSGRSLEGYLTEDNMYRFKSFYDNYLKEITTEPIPKN